MGSSKSHMDAHQSTAPSSRPGMGKSDSKLYIVLQCIWSSATTSPVDPMDIQCNSENISQLSKLPFNWKDVGIHFLSDESIQKIERELMCALTEENQKIKVLSMWLENKKAMATYNELARMLETMKNTAAADGVKQLLASNGANSGKTSYP